MGLNLAQYTALLKKLMPRGPAWTREIGTTFHGLFEAMAEEFVRLDARVGTDLLSEADPTTATELIEEWENFLGIPDDIIPLATTIEERRLNVLYRIVTRGGQSRAYFIALALRFGIVITITEYTPFVAGSLAGDLLYGDEWAFAWLVTAPGTEITYFVAGSPAGDPIADWGNDTLEAIISQLKPAHTVVLFGYT